MNRLALPILGAFVLATVAQAGGLAGSGEQHLHQRRQNQDLIQILVDGGLQLAGERDPLKRAEYCTNLAGSLVREIEHAARGGEKDRAVELGGHLRDVLQLGVAPNLTSVRARTPLGSTREADIRRVGDEAWNVTKPLESLERDAGGPDQADWRQLLRDIRTLRADVRLEVKRTSGAKAELKVRQEN
jgi:hypothetical protein